MKIVRVLIAAATATIAAVAFQLATSDAGAADKADCGICWPGGTVAGR